LTRVQIQQVFIVATNSSLCNSSSACLIPVMPRLIIDKSKASPRDITIEISCTVARLARPDKKAAPMPELRLARAGERFALLPLHG